MASFYVDIRALGANEASIYGSFTGGQSEYAYQRMIRVTIDGYGTIDIYSSETSGGNNTFSEYISGLAAGRTYSWSATLYYVVTGGWAASTYTDSGSFTTEQAAIPVYYIWINYDASGGSGGPQSQFYDNGGSGSNYVQFYVPDSIPIKSGYEFQYWTVTGPNVSSGTTRVQGQSLTLGGYTDQYTAQAYYPYTLTAVWKQVATTYYAYLSYNANGGSGAPSRTEHTFASNPVEAIISSVEPTRDGYTFAGWWLYNIESHGTYAAGSKIKVEGSTNKTTALNNYNHMLYAQWKKGDGAGVAWVYDGKWKEAIPYVYDGGWKEAGGNVYNSGWKETV